MTPVFVFPEGYLPRFQLGEKRVEALASVSIHSDLAHLKPKDVAGFQLPDFDPTMLLSYRERTIGKSAGFQIDALFRATAFHYATGIPLGDSLVQQGYPRFMKQSESKNKGPQELRAIASNGELVQLTAFMEGEFIQQMLVMDIFLRSSNLPLMYDVPASIYNLYHLPGDVQLEVQEHPDRSRVEVVYLEDARMVHDAIVREGLTQIRKTITENGETSVEFRHCYLMENGDRVIEKKMLFELKGHRSVDIFCENEEDSHFFLKPISENMCQVTVVEKKRKANGFKYTNRKFVSGTVDSIEELKHRCELEETWQSDSSVIVEGTDRKLEYTGDLINEKYLTLSQNLISGELSIIFDGQDYTVEDLQSLGPSVLMLRVQDGSRIVFTVYNGYIDVLQVDKGGEGEF